MDQFVTEEEIRTALAALDAWRANARERGLECIRGIDAFRFMDQLAVVERDPAGVGFGPKWMVDAYAAGQSPEQIRATHEANVARTSTM